MSEVKISAGGVCSRPCKFCPKTATNAPKIAYELAIPKIYARLTARLFFALGFEEVFATMIDERIGMSG